MSILVTGAAGFIGCNNVIALNRRGITDVIAVDNLEKGDKFKNLAQCQISDYFDNRDFIGIQLSILPSALTLCSVTANSVHLCVIRRHLRRSHGIY